MKNQYIIMNGFEFKERTCYVVEVAMHGSNPIFQDIFYTGFLNGPDKSPGGYNRIIQTDTEFKDLYYMKIIRELNTEIHNENKMVRNVLTEDYPEALI